MALSLASGRVYSVVLLFIFITSPDFTHTFQNILSGSGSKKMQQSHFGSQTVKTWHQRFVKKKPKHVWGGAAVLKGTGVVMEEEPSCGAWAACGVWGACDLFLQTLRALWREPPPTVPQAGLA